MLDEDQLGIIPDRCDGCSLCAPACTEAAIASDIEVLTGVHRNFKTALLACSQSLPTSSSQGVVSCLHAMGLYDLLTLYRQGCRSLFFLHADCDQCHRGTVTRIQNRISQLNRLLQQRSLPPIEYSKLTESKWLRLCETIAQENETPISRRNFLRRAVADFVDHSLNTTLKDKDGANAFAPPGALLQTETATDQQFCFPVFDTASCNACHACVHLCPHEAILLQNDGQYGYRINPQQCTGCKLCMDSCDQDAIHVNFWKTPETIFIPLEKNTCKACGAEYSTTSSANHGNNEQKCHICTIKNQLSNLYQVLEN